MVNYLPKTDFIMNWITVTFPFVLISHNEIWWIPYNVLKGKRSVCTNIESDSWAKYRGNTNGLKSVNKSVNGSDEFQKTLQIKAKT